MKKIITFNSIVYLILFASFLQIKLANAQCASVNASSVTIAGATCPGNGSITLPSNLPAGSVFKLSGGGLTGDLVQSSPVFESLSAATYTVTLLCSGEPTNSFDVTVPDKHSALGMSIVSDMVCEGEGTVTATGTGGFDQGNSGTYQYALWPESAGGANRPDAQVTYGSSNTWNNLSTANYYVRVKDGCGNIFTQFIWVQASKPTAKIELGSPTITCLGGSYKYEFPNAILKSVPGDFTVYYLGTAPKYKYRIEQINGDCNTAVPIATVVPDTDLADPSSLTISPVIPGQTYRIVITSPCGNVETSTCVNIDEALVLEGKSTLACAPNVGKEYLTINVYTLNGYQIQFPGTVTIVGTGYNQVVPFTNFTELGAIQKFVPTSAYPLTITYQDQCLTKTINRNAPPADGSPGVASWQHYHGCVSTNGNVNLNVWLEEGNWYGLEYNSGADSEKTKYELINQATGTVVRTQYGLSSVSNNLLAFSDVSAGITYFIRVMPPASATSSTCGPQESAPHTVSLADGMNFTVAPTVERVCNDGSNIIRYNITNNTDFQITEANLYRGTSASGTVVSTQLDPTGLAPGTYYYVIGANNGCSTVTREGTITIDSWVVNPTISRSLSVNCQQLGSGPQNTGSTLLQFDGYGPFVVERSINGGTYTVVDAAAASSYTEVSLVAGSVYNYRVTDQCGKSVSQQVMIKPLSPRITNNIMEPCENAPYTLSGIDFGDPLTTYKWEKVGTSGVLATTREYTIPNFTTADNGSYKLTISLMNGCVVREVTVKLNSANCGNPFATGSIGDKVWFDTNSDGIQDASESGVPGAKVILQGYVGPASPTAADLANDNNWALAATTYTDGNGNYLFDGLSSGYYRVNFGTVANYGFTSYMQGSDPALNSDAGIGGYSSPVLINADGIGIDKDNMTVDAGLIPAGSIGDYVWQDDNQNGKQDAGEPAISGLSVKLYVKNTSGGWDLLKTTTTDGNGEYLFDGLPTGTYQVEFVLPGGFSFTHPNVAAVADTEDSDADKATGRSGEISINTTLAETDNGRNNMTIDAGLVKGQLPVKLSSFVVEKGEGASAVLKWTTTEEVNSLKFVIQRSMDAKIWAVVGEVPAKVNSNGIINYRYDDMTINLGNNYYRLKMIDTDDSFSYSSIRTLNGEIGKTVLSLYPNPANSELSVVSTTGGRIGKVEVINGSGKVVISQEEINTISNISVKNLPAGVYVVKITFQDGFVENGKVVIVH